jgi:hypothetical protein
MKMNHLANLKFQISPEFLAANQQQQQQSWKKLILINFPIKVKSS